MRLSIKYKTVKWDEIFVFSYRRCMWKNGKIAHFNTFLKPFKWDEIFVFSSRRRMSIRRGWKNGKIANFNGLS